MTTAIEVKNISKIYKLYDKPTDRLKESLNPFKKNYHRDFYALNNISFNVNQGDTIGIIGKNGSGKSTLLKILTGVLTPSVGSVQVNGKVSALLELGAGFNPEYTGLENIYLNGAITGYCKEEITAKLDQILSFADIGDFISQSVKIYSSGMFARLAFAVAINVDPDILIIDETLSVGDVAFQARCFKKFQEFQKLGKTILFVTHSTESIVKFCNKGIVLDKGIKMAEGPSREMVELYKKLLVNCNSCNEEIVSNNEDIIENSISWRHSFNINPYFLDYGNKKAEIIDFGIFDANNHPVHTLLNDEEYEFRMKIKFNETIEEPIFAYIIKDLKGTIITGTNNTMEHIISGTFLKDDYIYVTFRQRINLQSQNYMISFGCTGFINEEFVVYHRLYDVIIFDVISDKTISGFFDPKSIISIVKSQN